MSSTFIPLSLNKYGPLKHSDTVGGGKRWDGAEQGFENKKNKLLCERLDGYEMQQGAYGCGSKAGVGNLFTITGSMNCGI